jgi:hypothetical protein
MRRCNAGGKMEQSDRKDGPSRLFKEYSVASAAARLTVLVNVTFLKAAQTAAAYLVD